MFGRGAKTDVPYTAIEAIMVLPGKEAEFIDWDRRYEEAMTDVPGYLGSETLAPAPPESANPYEASNPFKVSPS
jgi:antibiotic biosynthesis monooxygenase (ABM) superfamily enzyme